MDSIKSPGGMSNQVVNMESSNRNTKPNKPTLNTKLYVTTKKDTADKANKKNKVMPLIMSAKGASKREEPGSFRVAHAKLFKKNDPNKSIANKKYKRNGLSCGKTTLFELIKQDISEPFEKARESKATIGQISIINNSMIILTLFSVLIGSLAYIKEFDEKFDNILYVLLSMNMVVSIISAVFLYIKLKYTLQLYIYRKQAHANSSILQVFKFWQEIVPQFIFILLHPSPFLVGRRVWVYINSINNMYYYHINDF